MVMNGYERWLELDYVIYISPCQVCSHCRPPLVVMEMNGYERQLELDYVINISPCPICSHCRPPQVVMVMNGYERQLELDYVIYISPCRVCSHCHPPLVVMVMNGYERWLELDYVIYISPCQVCSHFRSPLVADLGACTPLSVAPTLPASTWAAQPLHLTCSHITSQNQPWPVEYDLLFYLIILFQKLHPISIKVTCILKSFL